jgi:hypothetical protein
MLLPHDGLYWTVVKRCGNSFSLSPSRTRWNMKEINGNFFPSMNDWLPQCWEYNWTTSKEYHRICQIYPWIERHSFSQSSNNGNHQLRNKTICIQVFSWKKVFKFIFIMSSKINMSKWNIGFWPLTNIQTNKRNLFHMILLTIYGEHMFYAVFCKKNVDIINVEKERINLT